MVIHINRMYRNGIAVLPEQAQEGDIIPSWGDRPLSETEAAYVSEHKTAYYKSKRGKLRKAGNSKPRPGEELVYLTAEEENRLDSQ